MEHRTGPASPLNPEDALIYGDALPSVEELIDRTIAPGADSLDALQKVIGYEHDPEADADDPLRFAREKLKREVLLPPPAEYRSHTPTAETLDDSDKRAIIIATKKLRHDAVELSLWGELSSDHQRLVENASDADFKAAKDSMSPQTYGELRTIRSVHKRIKEQAELLDVFARVHPQFVADELSKRSAASREALRKMQDESLPSLEADWRRKFDIRAAIGEAPQPGEEESAFQTKRNKAEGDLREAKDKLDLHQGYLESNKKSPDLWDIVVTEKVRNADFGTPTENVREDSLVYRTQLAFDEMNQRLAESTPDINDPLTMDILFNAHSVKIELKRELDAIQKELDQLEDPNSYTKPKITPDHSVMMKERFDTLLSLGMSPNHSKYKVLTARYQRLGALYNSAIAQTGSGLWFFLGEDGPMLNGATTLNTRGDRVDVYFDGGVREHGRYADPAVYVDVAGRIQRLDTSANQSLADMQSLTIYDQRLAARRPEYKLSDDELNVLITGTTLADARWMSNQASRITEARKNLARRRASNPLDSYDDVVATYQAISRDAEQIQQGYFTIYLESVLPGITNDEQNEQANEALYKALCYEARRGGTEVSFGRDGSIIPRYPVVAALRGQPAREGFYKLYPDGHVEEPDPSNASDRARLSSQVLREIRTAEEINAINNPPQPGSVGFLGRALSRVRR